ncbi:hypothetical protein FQN60_013474 [Etheostoma spectabile]|uniref:Uncharacterized protein n=1 Tax=Etheostoma spectabile TaxID=54343 RepID=A0A5J5CIY7_9PERO|nr:hypothetical protein FQN60_013474 [Etheostoma spectabile]
MTEVAPSCTEMTALAPPPAPLITSRNASPARSPSGHNSPPEKLEWLQDKERRAQQQLVRCAEERGRKMEVQRRKEQQRRAAAEEKRRQQQEAEKRERQTEREGEGAALLDYVSLSERRASDRALETASRHRTDGCERGRRGARLLHAVTMAQLSPCASPGTRRRSDGSVRECLFFPISERNEQERLEALVRRRAGGAERRGGGGGGGGGGGEARDHLDNRPKRWTWGGPPDGVEGEYDGS